MAIEQSFLSIAPRLFTADGTISGIITTSSTAGVKVKQKIVVKAPSLPDKEVQVKRVISKTQFKVGPLPGKDQLQGKAGLKTVEDISLYTVALGSYFYAAEQDKPKIKPDDMAQATYDQEPTVAWRVVFVDQYGNYYDDGNPLPIAFDGTIAVGNVTIQDDDGDELAIEPDGSINVNVLNASAAIPSDPFIANVNASSANTEYSFTFPAKTIRFTMKIRDGMAKTRIAWTSGGTSTTYFTINMGSFYTEETQVGSKTIYFQTNKASQIVELLYWVQP